MFLGAGEPGQEARTSRAMPRVQASRAPLDGPLLPVMAFFLAMAVGWLVFSGTAARLLEPAGVTELRNLRKISAAVTPARFDLCNSRTDTECVVDGDTLRHHGMIVRLADIDTPETRDYGCAAEKQLGDLATRRLLQLLNAGPFELGGYERDEDQYGRKLRIVRRGGQSLGMVLVREGLAREWDGARRPWC